MFETKVLHLLRQILEELRAQRILLEKPRFAPQPEPFVTIRSVTLHLSDERCCWMNLVAGPGLQTTTHRGITKTGGLERAELLALYDALQQVFQYPAAHEKLRILFCAGWLEEMVIDHEHTYCDTQHLHVDTENEELAGTVLHMLDQFTAVKVSSISIDEDSQLFYLARDIGQMRTEILENEKCSQQAESESSQKKTKSSNTKVPTESS